MAKRQSASPGLTRKQTSRAKREARIQRIVLISTGVIVAAVVLLLGYGLLNQYYLLPHKVLAKVGDKTITAQEFEQRVKFEYFIYSVQPYQFSAFDASSVMDQMVNEILIEKQADELGVTVSDEELDKRVELAFGYDAGDPEPTATAIPTDVGSDQTTTPTVTPTFVFTLTPSPTPTLDPSITPTATLEATEESTAEATSEGTAEATEEATEAATETPAPTPTPLDEAGYKTRLDDFITQGTTLTDLTDAQIRALIRERIRSGIISDEVYKKLDFDVEKTKTLVNAAHILVDTEEEAKDLYQQIKDGASFEELAAEHSKDTSNNYKGGNLGWFGKGDMVAEFEAVAFDTPVGEISEPVQTSFGWHLIKVYDKVDQPTTYYEQEQAKQTQFQAMIEEWKTAAGVTIEDNYMDYAPNVGNSTTSP